MKDRNTREMNEICKTCKREGIDPECLSNRVATILRFRNKKESNKFAYAIRRHEMELSGNHDLIGKTKRAIYELRDLEANDEDVLVKNLVWLSGSGLLDRMIDDSINLAASSFASVGVDYYKPILELRYDGGVGEQWWIISQKINLSRSQTNVRRTEAILAMGIAFYTCIADYYISMLKE